ncbi:MAG: hypothetical protein JW863_17780 [Chitinispirillaceae bacterium]|nr:hypothetical protein [Chitinispirillaceae bacterium]
MSGGKVDAVPAILRMVNGGPIAQRLLHADPSAFPRITGGSWIDLSR